MMTTYKLRIIDRQLSEFGIVDAYTLKEVPIPYGFNPFEKKMFTHKSLKILRIIIHKFFGSFY